MIKQILLMLFAITVLSLLIHKKMNTVEEFNSDNSISYLSNGTVTKLFGIQNFKLDDNQKEYLIFNGIDAFLKIPTINSTNVVISFKLKTSKENNLLLSTSDGSYTISISNGRVVMTSPELQNRVTHETTLLVDRAYMFELGIKGKNGYISIDDEKVEFDLMDEIKTRDINIGKDFSSKHFFEGEIGDINIVRDKDVGGNLLNNFKYDTCEWTAIGKTRQECIDKCEMYVGCENKTEECSDICNSCTDSNKCEWLGARCNYKASGEDYTDCVHICLNNSQCNWKDCVDKCTNCGPECPWIKKATENIQKYYEPPKKGNNGAPDRPRIRVETSNGMASIYFKAPNSPSPIETYIYFLYKTFKKNQGVKIGLIPFSDCKNCVHIFENLDPNETYTVGIRAYNTYGDVGRLSEMSNKVTFKPRLESDAEDVGLISIDALLTSDAYMNNYHFCNN